MSHLPSYRVLMYSHDAYGMGNIRRTLAICRQLTESLPNISILLLTGSPIIHALRIPPRVDYLKLPCLTRDRSECFSAKYWDIPWKELIKMRSDIMLSAVKRFRPDLVLVDKKPAGIKREFLKTVQYIRKNMPRCRLVLGLRDILDDPRVTVPIWRSNGYFDLIEKYYHQVWIYGSPAIFDAVREYHMPEGVARKVVYTGYLGRPLNPWQATAASDLPETNGNPLSLVMVGGGGDGFPLLNDYLEGVLQGHLRLPANHLLISGPEMPADKRELLQQHCANGHPIGLREYTDAIENYLRAADMVVSMGGYNSVCEILSFRKRAVIVPRITPVSEQFIRARRLARLGLIRMIDPRELSPQRLMAEVEAAYRGKGLTIASVQDYIDLNGLPKVAELTRRLCEEGAAAAERSTVPYRHSRSLSVPVMSNLCLVKSR
ncbi:MAG: glycosyltransferase [Calditrichaeota bacterium]|nr:MAG: glycosyltransferase [Calditrichota bacterium]